jgi:hypothetical protein
MRAANAAMRRRLEGMACRASDKTGEG